MKWETEKRYKQSRKKMNNWEKRWPTEKGYQPLTNEMANWEITWAHEQLKSDMSKWVIK